jgi:hypothetical protein
MILRGALCVGFPLQSAEAKAGGSLITACRSLVFMAMGFSYTLRGFFLSPSGLGKTSG